MCSADCSNVDCSTAHHSTSLLASRSTGNCSSGDLSNCNVVERYLRISEGNFAPHLASASPSFAELMVCCLRSLCTALQCRSRKRPFMMSTLLASSSSLSGLFLLPEHHDARNGMCVCRHHRDHRVLPQTHHPPVAHSPFRAWRVRAPPRGGACRSPASRQAFATFASGRCGLFLLMACPGKRPGHRFDLRKSAAAWILALGACISSNVAPSLACEYVNQQSAQAYG